MPPTSKVIIPEVDAILAGRRKQHNLPVLLAEHPDLMLAFLQKISLGLNLFEQEGDTLLGVVRDVQPQVILNGVSWEPDEDIAIAVLALPVQLRSLLQGLRAMQELGANVRIIPMGLTRYGARFASMVAFA